MILSMPINMALLYNAMMVYHDVFTPVYSHTRQTTQRSKFNFNFEMRIYSCFAHERVLFASIRNKGASPCPRCLVPLHRTHTLGQHEDRQERIMLRRVADSIYTKKVASAREWIYKKNKGVKSKYVEDILKLDSIAPTSVSDSV